MRLRRAVGLLLLLTVGLSSAEVLLAGEEPPVTSSAVAAALDTSAPAEESAPDDCACLCACGCVNAQVVVAPEAAEFCVTGAGLLASADASLVFTKRARPRPHLRPPLA
ncbi:MAG: hypothetical protein ACRELX_03010 [Longimicrobiales bacterium]